MTHAPDVSPVVHRSRHLAEVTSAAILVPDPVAAPWVKVGPKETHRLGEERLRQGWSTLLRGLITRDVVMASQAQLARELGVRRAVVSAMFNQMPSVRGAPNPVSLAIANGVAHVLHCPLCMPAEPQAVVVAAPTPSAAGSGGRGSTFGLSRSGVQRMTAMFAGAQHGDDFEHAYEIPVSGRLEAARHDYLDINLDAVRDAGRMLARTQPVHDRLRDVAHHHRVLEAHRPPGVDPLAVIIIEAREEAHGLAGTKTADSTWSYVNDEGWHDAVMRFLPGVPTIVEAGDGRAGGGGLHEDFVYFAPHDARPFAAAQISEAADSQGPHVGRFEDELIAVTGGPGIPEMFRLRGTVVDRRTKSRSVCFLHFGAAAVPTRFFLVPLHRNDTDDVVDSARLSLLHAFRAVLGASNNIGQCRRNAYLAGEYITNPASAPGSRELTFHIGGAIRLGDIWIPGQ